MADYVKGGLSALIGGQSHTKTTCTDKSKRIVPARSKTASSKKGSDSIRTNESDCNFPDNLSPPTLSAKARISANESYKIEKIKRGPRTDAAAKRLKQLARNAGPPTLEPSGNKCGETTEEPAAKKRKLIQNKFINNSETASVNTKVPANASIPSFQMNQRQLGNKKKIQKATKCNNTESNEIKNKLTVYVGNLPLTYDHKKVIKLFSKFGPVESARIRCVPIPDFSYTKKRSAITKQFHPSRSSIAAYVVFKSESSVSKAVAENGMVVDDHHLRIDYAQPEKRDLKKSIFVGGLPFDTEDDELWEFFKDCGEIESVRVVRDGSSSMGKGFGYVNFKSSASVELALHLDNQQMKKCTINVQRWSKLKNKKKEKLKTGLNQKKHKNIKWKKGAGNPSRSNSVNHFQGVQAEQKQKKKKRKLSKNARRENKIKAILNPSS